MTTLIIATRNKHKVQEIRDILGPAFRCLQLNDFPEAPSVVEDAETFAGNATKKALSLAGWLEKNQPAMTSDYYVLADDSGLEVDALNGAPGVHSARFAADGAPGSVNTSDAANNAKLLRLLECLPPEKRTARFRCVLALLRVGEGAGQVVVCDGTCEGKISTSVAGQGGFGYDPLFVPNGCIESFAELGEATKNKMSHRARALARLKSYFETSGQPGGRTLA
jgi:XTP/dITP diphosphohydrolase